MNTNCLNEIPLGMSRRQSTPCVTLDDVSAAASSIAERISDSVLNARGEIAWQGGYACGTVAQERVPTTPVTPMQNSDWLAKDFAYLEIAFEKLGAPVCTASTRIVYYDPNANFLAFELSNQNFGLSRITQHSRGKALHAPFGTLVQDGDELLQQIQSEWRASLPKIRVSQAAQAPEWLAKRMEASRRTPPRSLREVASQLKASAEVTKRLTAKRLALSNGPSKGKRS